MPRTPIASDGLSADELWRAGRYVEALALDEWVEFRFSTPILTHAQVCAAAALRKKLGLDDER